MILLKPLQSFAMWLVWNVPLGRFAPHVFAFAMGSGKYKCREAQHIEDKP